ncbi:hypothetical protein N656DRAFT_772948 [Canariomyces notabilis]|uniref:Uncharacterized protein n=1 Tax=Canariomyces notabilis TaxID=2074819 RepID=A0AAN6TLZ3_9PEZI|nr:hypothetical protein N656DRAFT_772948 [Canariomyces arenarius]
MKLLLGCCRFQPPHLPLANAVPSVLARPAVPAHQFAAALGVPRSNTFVCLII